MVTERFDFSGYNGVNLTAMLWLPEGETKAILQITHNKNVFNKTIGKLCKNQAVLRVQRYIQKMNYTNPLSFNNLPRFA